MSAALRSMEHDFLSDIVRPGINDFLMSCVDWVADTVKDFGRQAIYGDSDETRRSYHRDRKGRSYVSYDRISSKRAQPTAKERREMARRGARYEDSSTILVTEGLKSPVDPHLIVFRNEKDARAVHHRLLELATRYDYAQMSALYQHSLVGIEPSWTDHQIGWTQDDIRQAPILRRRGGYIIDLPPYRDIERDEEEEG